MDPEKKLHDWVSATEQRPIPEARSTKKLKVSEVSTWMSQEVSKWLVNGL